MVQSLGKRRPDGFLERGREVTRVEAFVDAAFAFAVTVLAVRAFDGCENHDQLVYGLKLVPGLFLCFAVLGMFWWAHQTWSRRYGLDNPKSVLLSLFSVFLVAIYVYPLQLMFQSGLAWLSWLLLPESMRLPWLYRIESSADIVDMFVVYALVWISIGLVIAGLYREAWLQRDALELNLEERVQTKVEIVRWLWVPATGCIALALIYVLSGRDDGLVGLSGFAYALMGLTGVVQKSYAKRVRPSITAEWQNRGAAEA